MRRITGFVHQRSQYVAGEWADYRVSQDQANLGHLPLPETYRWPAYLSAVLKPTFL